jgi:hypothetical protein
MLAAPKRVPPYSSCWSCCDVAPESICRSCSFQRVSVDYIVHRGHRRRLAHGGQAGARRSLELPLSRTQGHGCVECTRRRRFVFIVTPTQRCERVRNLLLFGCAGVRGRGDECAALPAACARVGGERGGGGRARLAAASAGCGVELHRSVVLVVAGLLESVLMYVGAWNRYADVVEGLDQLRNRRSTISQAQQCMSSAPTCLTLWQQASRAHCRTIKHTHAAQAPLRSIYPAARRSRRQHFWQPACLAPRARRSAAPHVTRASQHTAHHMSQAAALAGCARVPANHRLSLRATASLTRGRSCELAACSQRADLHSLAVRAAARASPET